MATHTALEILQKYWKYDSFRPLQEDIIQSVLSGHDTLALMPTGGGKSICYQIPALCLPGLCLVVSPLISLMKDQVQQLTSRGIKARCLTSGTTNTEQEIIFNNCQHGNVKLLYVSPERLSQRSFRERLRYVNVSLIAVDEAHCISQWGYDFRPSYLEIAKIRDYHSHAPVIALTATATPEVAQDIQRQLMFRPGCQFFQSSFLRSNLAYMVIKENEKEGRMLRIIQRVGGSQIIYVRNRRRTREIANYLVAQGIPAAYYHAGLDPKERDIAQKRWSEGSVCVIVATNAFGMGIDKPDVRLVLHMDIPSSIEAYFQEAGRAGRDGAPAYAVTLYNDMDIQSLQRNFETEYPTRQQVANIYRAICNYYQIPVGSGEGCTFDFNMEGICNTYSIKPLDLFSATKFIEREGLIDMPDREDAESELYIPLSREDLYRFQVEQVRYCDLITLLLRNYGGLFTDFVPVSEKSIARKMYMDKQTIRNMLLHLDALKVVHYKPKRTHASIIFTSPRIDAKDLYLSEANYKSLKDRAQQRMESVIQYMQTTDTCRSQQLLSYFGEHNSQPCGICDHCLTAHKPHNKSNLREQIIALLKEKPMRGETLLQQIAEVNENEVRDALRQLIDEQIVSINQNLEFFV